MDRIGVVGLSWRDRRGNLIDQVTVPREQRAERLPGVASRMEVEELVYLATCNRVEIAFTTDGQTSFATYRRRAYAALRQREPNPGEAELTFRIWQGEGAVEHLFVVAAGLDSARVGESEIALQLRDAIEQARDLHLLRDRLGLILPEALRVARRVRRVTAGRVQALSLADLGVRRVLDRLTQAQGTVALIGVSPMTERCGRALRAQRVPLIVVNRTESKAVALAESLGASARSLETFREVPDPVEALIVATGAAEPILRRADLERIAAQTTSAFSPLVVDFGVPPNVAPEDASAADVTRVGMGELTEEANGDRALVLGQFADARVAVDEALTELRRTLALRKVGPIIAELRRRYRQTALEGVERLFRRRLPHLAESEREEVRRWAETLSRRFAHIPTLGLRELAFQAGPAAVEAFLAAGDPSLVRTVGTETDQGGLPHPEGGGPS